MTDCIYVYVSCADMKEARKIAGYCVTQRIAACGNILPGMESVYWWDDDVQSNQEVVLILKSKSDNFPAIEKAVKSLHSYKCPCITALPVAMGSEDYLNWIRSESTK